MAQGRIKWHKTKEGDAEQSKMAQRKTKCHRTLYSATGKYNTTQAERKKARQDKTTKRSVNWQKKKENGIRKI